LPGKLKQRQVLNVYSCAFFPPFLFSLVAFTTSFSVTGPLETIFYVIPVTGVRVDLEAALGTVTFKTDIAIRMAGLAGSQIFPRFAGMAIRPLMARQH
jgi:hypothetical protein